MPAPPNRTYACALLLALTGLVPASAVPASRGAAIQRWTAALDGANASLRSGDLDAAGEAFSRVLSELPPDAGPPLLRARGLDGLGDVERLRGNLEPAADAYRRAVPLWEELLGPRQPRLAVTLHNLGAVLVDAGRRKEAIAVLERALTIWSASPESTREADSTRLLLARARAVSDGS